MPSDSGVGRRGEQIVQRGCYVKMTQGWTHTLVIGMLGFAVIFINNP